ncbi:MAG: TRAP transporter large permease [Candidatus Methylomirabilota bacterium]
MLVFSIAIATLLMGLPVVFVLGMVSLAYLYSQGMPLVLVAQRLFVGMDSFVLLAIPFYILMGDIMCQGKVTDILVNWAKTIVGRVRGGLGAVTIIVEIIFSGISGSGSADASALGSILIPAMEKEKYDKDFAAAVVATASILGPIIPPSIIMVVYAVVAEESIGALFLAGIIPGLIMGGADILIVLWQSYRRKYSRAERRATFREFLQQTREAALALMAPGIILAGILTGFVTPTEAGILAVVYCLFLAMIYYKTLTWRDMPRLLYNTVLVSCGAYLLVGMCSIFGWVMSAQGIPAKLAAFILSITTNKFAILFLINIVFLVAGCVMESIAAIILLVPIFLPLTKSLGVDPVHLGLIVCLNLSVGFVTPPVGASLFILGGLTKLSIDKIARACFPFIVVNILILFWLTYSPGIVMWLPKLIFK